MPNKKINIIFFGTPDFSVPTLRALAKASFCIVKAVITVPDKAVGRHHSQAIPSPVKQAAWALKLPVLEGLEALKGIEADLGVVVAFGAILPQWILDKFPLGVLNIHPSLLPKYRGPSPIQAAILNQDKETGVSLIQLDAEMDHGPIVAQENHPLTPSLVKEGELHRGHTPSCTQEGAGGWSGPTAGELHDELAQISAEMLIKCLPDYAASKFKPVPQDDSKASYTKKLTKADGKIDWSKSPAEIAAHVRAMNPWPGAWTMWKGKRLIIWKASLVSLRAEPEAIAEGVAKQSNSRDKDNLSDDSLQRIDKIASARSSPRNDNVVLSLEKVQLEGKKKMPFAEFIKGHPEFKLR